MRSLAAFLLAATLLAPLPAVAGGAREAERIESSDAAGRAGSSSSGDGSKAGGAGAADDAASRSARDLVPGGVPRVPGFTTDFSRSTVPADEIVSGGPPKDGIPAIDAPRFVSVSEADWIESQEPVLVVSVGEATHVYPVQILMFHEIVNDRVGGVPLAVTYCPLCNTGIVFERELDGQVLDFGTTGRLRFSNLLMYDRQTESWWQQATGEAVVGRHAGAMLDFHPATMFSWERAVELHPDARVLSRDTGFSRSYGTNPYAGYDTADRPFLYRGPDLPQTWDPMTRVVQVIVGDGSEAIPYPVLRDEGLAEREIGGAPVVVFWEPGTASALDTRSLADGRDVGTANAFRAEHDGRRLSFRRADRPANPVRFTDDATGSIWDAAGRAVDGPLAGERLEPLVGVQHFWFSYTAFQLDGPGAIPAE